MKLLAPGILAGILIQLLSLSAFADSPPPACASMDLRAAQVGTKCVTSKGATFERVARDHFGEAWKGPDDVIWSDDLGLGSRHEAIEACKKLGASLPSGFDFKMGFLAGMHEVLPNSDEPWYWTTSTVLTFRSFFKDLFDGDKEGYVIDPRTEDLLPDLSNHPNDFRCISH